MDAEINLDLLKRISDISCRMSETRSLTPLLGYAMDEAMQLIGAERGYLVLVDSDGKLNFRVKRGPADETPQDAADQISTSILEQVLSTGQPLVLRNALGDGGYSQQSSVIRLAIRSVMCVPLIARGNTIGAIYLENRTVAGRFKDNQLLPVVFFANQAAVSIENASLNDSLEEKIAARTHELEVANSALERSWNEAVEANRLRTALLANIAHDLRAPLTIIVGSLSMMADGIMGEINPEQADWINKSRDSANHVLSLIDDVFDLTKLEMGMLTLYREETDLADYLTGIARIAEGLPWQAGVSLKLHLAENLNGIVVKLDPNRIRQVLLNFLSNAMKFTAQGSVTIHARFLADRGEVLIGVRDTGEGIDPDKARQLFERFHQVDDNKTRRRQGTGLGLAISRDLVGMHGGQIWVESRVGEGSDFLFTLPLKPPQNSGPDST